MRRIRLGSAPSRVVSERSPRGGTLGGAGLAVSALSPYRREALELAAWMAGGECQRTLYTQSGGQPGHLDAWRDETANGIAGNFFRDTLLCMEEAYVRPNLPGFGNFQAAAANAIHQWLLSGGEAQAVIQHCAELYSRSFSQSRR